MKKKSNRDNIFNFFKSNVPLIGLLILIITFSIMSPVFLGNYNILNILRQSSINGLISFGMLVVILSGGIDLSVGTTLAFSSMIMAKLITSGVNPALAIIVAIIVGAIIGIINGIVISKGKVQPFIATLAMMLIFRGLTLYISNALPVSNLGEGVIGWVGRGYVLGIPVPVIILFITLLIFIFFLNKTVFGKKIYAIGGNEKAARLSGIKIEKNIIQIYLISGVLSALAGVILTSRIDSAVPLAGFGYELTAIAAVVIGGASLFGGRGKAFGTFVGILLIGILTNGLNLLGTSAYLQSVITGTIILIAVIADRGKKN